MSSINDEPYIMITDDSSVNSISDRPVLYRSNSAKRTRDPSQRKCVSFNDVPTVHEVPLHDTMRNSNYDTNRSWTYVDTPPTVCTLTPFTSTNPLAQRLNINCSFDSTKQEKSYENNNTNRNKNSSITVIPTTDDRITKTSSLSQSTVNENSDERKYSYHTGISSDTERTRTNPFAYVPVSESTATYTSMLTTNIHSSNEQLSNGQTRSIRARSAILPNHMARTNDNNSTNTTLRSTNSIVPTPKTFVKPTTIVFQCAQPATIAPILTNNHSSTISRPSTASTRINSSNVYSRLVTSANRPSLSTIKYNLTPYISDSSIKTSNSLTMPRSRSANILNARSNVNSSVVIIDGQSGGTNNSNLHAGMTKRNPNVRQTYGSYYMHRVLLPANIN